VKGARCRFQVQVSDPSLPLGEHLLSSSARRGASSALTAGSFPRRERASQRVPRSRARGPRPRAGARVRPRVSRPDGRGHRDPSRRGGGEARNLVERNVRPRVVLHVVRHLPRHLGVQPARGGRPRVGGRVLTGGADTQSRPRTRSHVPERARKMPLGAARAHLRRLLAPTVLAKEVEAEERLPDQRGEHLQHPRAGSDPGEPKTKKNALPACTRTGQHEARVDWAGTQNAHSAAPTAGTAAAGPRLQAVSSSA